MELIIIFIVSVVASLLSSMSGGGSGIITFPVFISLGLPVPLALNISSLNGTFWVVPASINYLKGRKIDWKFIIIFSLIGLVGAYFGVKFVLGTSARTFETIVGLLIIFLAFYTYFKKELGLNEHKIYSKNRQMLAYLFAPILGFYESFFGSGNGIIFSIIGFYTRGFDFIYALGYYYAISFSWCLFASILFIKAGFYDLKIMPISIIGSIIGAYTGSKYARYKGNRFIKIIFVFIGSILGLKLLLGL